MPAVQTCKNHSGTDQATCLGNPTEHCTFFPLYGQYGKCSFKAKQTCYINTLFTHSANR